MQSAHPFENKEKYPRIREATEEDYEAIYAIWMQDHIIQWMSFNKEPKKTFKEKFNKMMASSTIYVLVDKIDNAEKIVGVRRIKFGKDHTKHIAEYCSMGVDQAYLGRKYGKFFYEEFNRIVKEKGIRRIQITQSGGNFKAFGLADINGFYEEAVFPDWLERKNETGKYHLIERFIYQFLDKDLESLAKTIPSLKYQELFPSFISTDHQAIDIEATKKEEKTIFTCNSEKEPLFTLTYEPDNSVLQHIGFLSIELHKQGKQRELEAGLMQILTLILNEKRVKKLELFTSDPAVVEACKNLGFYVRGEKLASYYDPDKDEYKNELAVEYSFFNINDAKALTKAQVTDTYQRKSIMQTLKECQRIIDELSSSDTPQILLQKAYLENLAYQVVRDELAAHKVFSLAEKNWEPLLAHCPSTLKNNFKALRQLINPPSLPFFNKNNSIESSENIIQKKKNI